MTSAVAMLVGPVCRSWAIGPTDTGSALMLNDIWICASTITINGSQIPGAASSSTAGAWLTGEGVAGEAVVISVSPRSQARRGGGSPHARLPADVARLL